jgi:hypothetical protein
MHHLTSYATEKERIWPFARVTSFDATKAAAGPAVRAVKPD